MARWQWLAAAAAVAGVAVVPLLRRSASPVDAMDPGTFVEALASEDAGLPAGWNGRPWSTTRSAGDPLTPEARAVRVGARLVDLELAVRARDTSVAGIAADIAGLLAGIPASGPVAAIYRDVSHSAEASLEHLEESLDRGRLAATRLAGEELAGLGAWVESARVATARRDAEFFRSGPTRRTLARLRQLDTANEEARRAINRIAIAAGASVPSDWRMLDQDLTELLRILGS